VPKFVKKTTKDLESLSKVQTDQLLLKRVQRLVLVKVS